VIASDARNLYGEILSSGALVGSYVVDGLACEGGFASIYRGHHALTRERAALKVLRLPMASCERLTLRFRQEAEVISRLHHPHIVRILEVGELYDARPYIAMEWLDGRNLAQELRARGSFSEQEALAIMAEVGEAVAAAHHRGIIHRDLKPENVIAVPSGAWFSTKLVDFGIAKLTAPGDTPALVTAQTILGTPQSMAPEQILGLPVDARTDIYALGVMFYALVTGRLPFDGDTAVEVEEMHLHAAPPMPSELSPVSPDFDAVLARAMAKQKEQRYPSVQAFLDALRAVVRADSRLSAAAAPTPQRVSGIGLLIEVRQADGAAAGDLDLADEIDEILERARAAALAASMRVALDTGNALLAAVPLPEDELSCARTRALVFDRAHELAESLQAQAAPAGLVVAVSVHVDGLDVYGPDADLVGGPLLGLDQWPTQSFPRAP
jgi:tRNA A-37 threonylcarbamoyl transferase component Bud32